MIKAFTCASCIILLCTIIATATVKYVIQGGTGNGATWATAGNLQNILNTAVSGDTIWAKQGTYYASQTGNADTSFYLKNNVAIYGGFAGTETQLSQRADTTGALTVLSGTLSNGSYTGHILYGISTLDSTAVINGFTVSGAVLNVNAVFGGGAGMYNEGSPVLRNIIFQNNVLNIDEAPGTDHVGGGGGMYTRIGSPQLINVTFYNNTVNATGGANVGGSTGGGGIYIDSSSARMTNITFTENTVNNNGGAFAYGGALFIAGSVANPTVTNALFIKNVGNPNNSTLGSGIYQLTGSSTITNATFYANTFYPVYVAFGNMVIQNSITDNTMYNDYATLTINNTFLGGYGVTGMSNYTGVNNIISNTVPPPFVDTANGNYTLLACSAAVNAGNDAYNNTLTDIAGRPRKYGTIDMGAFECERANTLPDTLYVNGAATNPYTDGTSWAQAFPNLQTAMDYSCGSVYVKQIWVAAGTYIPSNKQDRETAFSMHNGTAVYGGFAGTETALNARDSTGATNETILSGEVQGDNDNTNNCYHVLFANTDSTAQLNGFTITGGYGNGLSDESSAGGGILSINGSTIFANLHITNNSVTYYGGGFANFSGSPRLINVVLKNNHASIGGNMYCDGSTDYSYYPSYSATTSAVLINDSLINGVASFGGGGLCDNYAGSILQNVTFLHNSAQYYGGGVMANISSSILTNVRFIDNAAYDTLGSSRGGGFYADGTGNSPVLSDILFAGNIAAIGGGVYADQIHIVLDNNTFFGNRNVIIDTNLSGGNSIYCFGSTVSLWNSIIDSGSNGSNDIGGDQNAVSVRNTLFEGNFPFDAFDSGNNMEHTNPLFANTAAGDYSLLACSPAIDAGNNSLLTASITTDLAGNPRRYNNGIVDMGAYEYQGVFEQPVITVAGDTLSTAIYNTYQWYRNGTLIPGATTASYTCTENGSYTVSVTDGNCSGTSAAVVIQDLGISNVPQAGVISVYPNPATSLIYINAAEKVNVTVLGLQGKLLLYKEAATDINISTLADGTYMLKITDQQGATLKVEKLVKMAY